ncbi:phenylalanine--tRNA ligase subunit beta [Microvirga tunisiensis]|jgi:phenylalanyl-tRNA synthetase beta chain|uniref:Phenylalanine--tRNA ligase beta subunit n=1 Tax=Microvirga tunisiensis TaxID=2108360 RepID=A0A5N7MF80_9HYPH|nr:phenylalanine--tRNA ligase subunit beta [Microvirga tunisiensis]MPR07186.1 phenylalanine--tRNA ligase subunit beta [Microvirga tunisiensis]MPR25433.1 phenylalanine--tRNA ligase subunit beta [Microvirga tunisiensis]
MKFTLSWLKDHLDTSASLDDIVETLTRIGLEVEEVEDKAKTLAPYKVAYVISAEQHPNADRLRVCMVDTGEGAPIQVVCGAPNARTGMKSVFAPPGTYIPGKNITLGIGTIRGVESAGMLCSAAELEISDDHDGIIDLAADAPVGVPYAAYAGLDDPVIEINLTPNRPDCTSIHGIARDLAAAGLGTLKGDAVPAVAAKGACPISVTIEDEKLCPAFALRLVRGVKNGPSPEWMQRRLLSIGLRPINALVDITNYVTFDRGRPLHVFDARKVKGNLTVRRAKEGEEVLALDTRTYRLDPSIVVIADDNGVESIGGIMGGEHSGCDENTTDVLIESALWDPLNIAQTGRKLGIITDARYRFERGVDPAFTVPGLDLATTLVIDLCGGEASEAVLAGKVPEDKRVIEFPWSEVPRLSGLDVQPSESEQILKALGFGLQGSGERVSVTAPSWRPDIEGKADLVEEVIRIAGVDRIEPKPLPRLEDTVAKPILTLIQKRTRLARRALAVRGLVEAVTWSFIARSEAELFGGGDGRLALANPIAAELSDMRPSLLPGLMKAAQRNADRGLSDVALFEVGQTFASDEPEGQSIKAAAVRRGTARAEGVGRHWDGGAQSVDAFDAKADVLALLAALGIPSGGLQMVAGGPAWFHPGRSGTLQFGPKNVVGAFGEVHPKVLKALDLKGPLVAFELNLDALPPPKAKPTKMKPKLNLPDFQPLTRDFAFVVGRDVAAGDIVKAAQGAERQLIVGVDVFDIYEGTGIDPHKKSVAIAVTLQPTEKTLTDVEIEAVSAKIVGEVSKKTGAVLRG